MDIKHLLISLLVNGLCIYIVASFLPWVSVNGIMSAMAVAGVFALVNHFAKPVIAQFALPVNLTTLSVFSLLVNGLLVLITDWLVQGFHVSNFIMAMIFGAILSVLNTLVGAYSLYKTE